jgi:uncharacterized metal-binding protein
MLIHKIGYHGISVAFSVDNAENMGKRNAIKSRVLEKNLNVYFVVCPYHKAHKYG